MKIKASLLRTQSVIHYIFSIIIGKPMTFSTMDLSEHHRLNCSTKSIIIIKLSI